ncbi:hypothetical protein MASR2M18_11110 [Ignavibacteria bacterium]|nr:molybdenum cofactor biosynthesis protein MoaE [Bacteroidota bacterium]MCZ2133356.1 molybdenum cofactor biosynthesis protein MoaE [Bacteroidota bacterium]
MKDKKHKVFVEGAVSPEFIAASIAKHSIKKNIGAHSIFLGQVRNDKVGNEEIIAIEYSAYIEMAEERFSVVREDIFEKYPLICMHIYHSIGRVNAGEISLFVFTSSAHRADAIKACEEIVERIKSEVAVWGKEILSNDEHRWKIN